MLSESLRPETTDFSSLVTALRPLIVLPVVSLPEPGPGEKCSFQLPHNESFRVHGTLCFRHQNNNLC